ncbi:hypothetical protein EVAR_82462_1 [Eumeta japonica]|uniref:Uncharacterized protein n=1 Tax=Eumeta variegata TaxID=151549 RepID=A0A4C1X8A2_EUMVA|nr:hypothetical protein EVAR_82462_1 [Eumeta japonica]
MPWAAPRAGAINKYARRVVHLHLLYFMAFRNSYRQPTTFGELIILYFYAVGFDSPVRLRALAHLVKSKMYSGIGWTPAIGGYRDGQATSLVVPAIAGEERADNHREPDVTAWDRIPQDRIHRGNLDRRPVFSSGCSMADTIPYYPSVNHSICLEFATRPLDVAIAVNSRDILTSHLPLQKERLHDLGPGETPIDFNNMALYFLHFVAFYS